MSKPESGLFKGTNGYNTANPFAVGFDDNDDDDIYHRNGHNISGPHDPFEEGFDDAPSSPELHKVNWKDATIGSYMREQLESELDEAYYYKMLGLPNRVEELERLLASDSYQFQTDGKLKGAVSELFSGLGNRLWALSQEETLGATLGAALAAALAGNAGPQVLIPEEVLTVPSAAALGMEIAITIKNNQRTVGRTYREELQKGTPDDIARRKAQGLGLVTSLADLAYFEGAEWLGNAIDIASDILNGILPLQKEKVAREAAERAVDQLLFGKSRTQLQKYGAVVGAYDVRTGEVVAAFSGTIPSDIHPELRKRADKIGGIGSYGLTAHNVVGKCAEFRAVNDLLNKGSNISDIRFTPARRPKDRKLMEYCDNCKKMFPDLIK